MTTAETTQPASPAEAAADAVDEQLAARLVEQAKTDGTSLVGPDGLLHRVTKLVLEHAPAGELTGHLGYEHGDPAGRNGCNSAQRQPTKSRDPRGRPGVIRKRS